MGIVVDVCIILSRFFARAGSTDCESLDLVYWIQISFPLTHVHVMLLNFISN